ncbi:MAG: hypothetical protein H6732_19925 [Alphaproteobacteria bacterium]|nr:hypothetical protein [Alphaproteobacteria bacterium]
MSVRFILPLLALGACAAPAEGLRPTPAGSGPEVYIDWDAEPLPEVPFPNDLSTTSDPASPTGLRLNVPLEAELDFESEARAKINALSGFGIYSPISVRFRARLDIDNLKQRHPNDLWESTTFDDDAVFVIDVDPDSPDRGKAVLLDLGHGRFPVDAIRTDKSFLNDTNDTRRNHASLIFDTYDEDLDGDGELDPGEDVDNDGLLDVPNVWPPGGDMFADLLSFYDLGTDTLIVRPAVPMREETTYAVVLTDRLVGEDGEPVRSPWDFVNHTRQTSALMALEDVLPDLGLSVDEVSFAWTFTTGRQTGDLRDLTRGLNLGEGPWAYLQEAYPAGVHEALQIVDRDGEDVYQLDTDILAALLGPLDLVGSGPGADTLVNSLRAFGDRMVGGTFTTPNLMADADDDGTWDADEWWKLDPGTGFIYEQPLDVKFTCVLPKPREGVQPPYDVMFYGHGYGSSRAETLTFSPTLTRFGLAVCSMDFPGHGVGLDQEDRDQAAGVLENAGLLPVLTHLEDSRARDLDNDGVPDSGGDQWTAYPFHTRDMVRQAALDWVQMVRSIRACGTGEMDLVRYGDGGEHLPSEGTRVSCDWDDDGTPDIGGPDSKIYIIGGSLGGINSGVAAPIVPDVDTWVPVVPGGGIVDVGIRTQIGGAVEAFIGRFAAPIWLGRPDPDKGDFRITQMVNSVTKMKELTIARVPSLPAGGTVRITNLTKKHTATGLIPVDGTFRVTLGADAADAWEKAQLAGIPATGPEPDAIYEVPNNEGLGDRFRVEILDPAGTVVHSIDRWQEDVYIEGVTMRAGSPLVAAAEGNGRIRGSADARRLAYITAMILEPGDPIAYAPHYFMEPFEDLGYGPRNVFIMPTPGDDQVPVNGGIAVARAAGAYPWNTYQERYGTSVDAWLIEKGVVHGVEERSEWRNDQGEPVLFDVEDFDEGTDGYGAPALPAEQRLRATIDTPAGQSGMRLPYVNPRGQHGFSFPDPTLPFDINTYAITQIADYLLSDGKMLRDRPCYEAADCPEFEPIPGAP